MVVRYFSFIGDLEDEGRFSYFVDDLLVATDPSVRLEPFVAPGRRRYFVEIFAGERPALEDRLQGRGDAGAQRRIPQERQHGRAGGIAG